MKGLFRTNAFSIHDKITTSNGTILIVVGSEGQPTGIWRGAIMDIESKARLTYGSGTTAEYMYYCGCTAMIKDSRAPKEWNDKEPSHDYYAVSENEAIPLLLSRNDTYRSEINGLKKNHAIEIKALHGAFRAMTLPESVQTLANIITEKKMSDTEAIEKLDILIKFFKEDFRTLLDAIDKQNK